jgi:hypothetical protein
VDFRGTTTECAALFDLFGNFNREDKTNSRIIY